jgi:hypothetical protein
MSLALAQLSLQQLDAQSVHLLFVQA